MIDINKEIERLDWSKEPKGLYEPIAYVLASGGKRLRPTLALTAAEVVLNGGLISGTALDDVLPAALALEVCPEACEAWEHVLELCEFDLCFGDGGACALGEDVEDECGAVEYADAEGFFEVAELCG